MKSSEYTIVWEVLAGLRTHDTKIWRRLGGGHDPEHREQIPLPPAPERADEIAPITGVRSHEPDTNLWAAGWTAAIRYFEHHQNLNVPSEYTDRTGYALGRWLGQQRSLYAAGSLAPDRALALISLGISWPHPPNSFEYHLDQAITCAETHGTLALVTATDPVDRQLTRWLTRQRALADSDRLHPTRVDALNAVDPWWNPPWDLHWQHTYAHIRSRLARGRHLNVLTPTADEEVMAWLDRQITRLPELHPRQVFLLTQLASHYPHLHPHAMLFLHNATPRARAFARALTAARQYLQREGHLKVPAGHREDVLGDEVLLGRWIRRRRGDTAQLTSAQISALTALGIDLEPVFRAAPPDPLEIVEEDEDWWSPPEPVKVAARRRSDA